MRAAVPIPTPMRCARSPTPSPPVTAMPRGAWPTGGMRPTARSPAWTRGACRGGTPGQSTPRPGDGHEGADRVLGVSARRVGGLGRHVHQLATQLALTGHEVVVLSRRPAGTDASTHPTITRIDEGVLVVAVAEDPPHFVFGEDMLAWTLAMGHAMVRAGLALTKGGVGDGWQPDVVHAHDWLVAHPAIALAEFFDVPLVSTLHATEAGRHSGWISGRINRQVHSVEWWLANESD